MSVVSVATPFNIDLEFNIASFGRRFLAWLIDTVIQILYVFAYFQIVQEPFDYDRGFRIFSLVVFLLLPLSLYHFLFEVFLNGQSIGKKALGIRVVNILGNRASVSQYVIRLMFRSFTIIPLIAMVVVNVLGRDQYQYLFLLVLAGLSVTLFITYLNSNLGQRFGDRLADTIVIEEKAKAEFHKTIYQEVAEVGYQVQYPQVMGLTDRDINGIRNLLDQRRITRDTQAYMDRIAARICEVLNIQTTQESYAFLHQLLRDYNWMSRK